MTKDLTEKTCTPCRGGVSPLTAQEAEELRGQAPEWALLEDARRIERTFRFRDFRDALTFVQKVGELAESEGHHPDIGFGWGYATVSLRTKKIKGLHEKDFIMAAKTDPVGSAAERLIACATAPLLSRPSFAHVAHRHEDARSHLVPMSSSGARATGLICVDVQRRRGSIHDLFRDHDFPDAFQARQIKRGV